MDHRLSLSSAWLFLRARSRWALVAAGVALLVHLSLPAPAERTEAGVAKLLGEAVRGEVRAGDFVWEARGGFWADAFLGRRALFVAHAPSHAPADVYRARVLLTRSGRPIAVTSVRNLTQSPLGDDGELIAQGRHAAYITRAFGAVQGVTLLDMSGTSDRPRGARAVRWLLQQFLTSGGTSGIGRIEVTFGRPVAELRAEFQGELLVMAVGQDNQPLGLRVGEGTLVANESNPYRARAQVIREPLASVAELAAEVLDLGTKGPTGGPTPDSLGTEFQRETITRATRTPPGSQATSDVPTASATESGPWPPPTVASPGSRGAGAEGSWEPVATRRISAGAPPCFFRTTLRPDPRSVDVEVELLAIDTRQVDLRLVAGVFEPRSLVGIHGTGRAADDVRPVQVLAVLPAGTPRPRALSAKGYLPGFVSDRQVLVPPVDGAPTVAIRSDGRVELGHWNASLTNGSVDSLKQTYDPLVGDPPTVAHPVSTTGARHGYAGLGVLRSGQLLYGWTRAPRPDALRTAFSLAGSMYAVPFASSQSLESGALLRSAPAETEGSESAGPEATQPWPRDPVNADAFFAVLRTLGPGLGAPKGSPPPMWKEDGGKQPTPPWLTAIYTSTATYMGTQVHFTRFGNARVAFRLDVSPREPSFKPAAAATTAEAKHDGMPVLATIGVGLAKKRAARGIILHGVIAVPFRGESGVLAVDRGRFSILRSPGMTVTEQMDAVELPLLAEDGNLRPEAREIGTIRPRTAACVLDDGAFLLATTYFDSDEAATTGLVDFGCRRVVALDRGAHQPSLVVRASADRSCENHYDETVLNVVDQPSGGRAITVAP